MIRIPFSPLTILNCFIVLVLIAFLAACGQSGFDFEQSAENEAAISNALNEPLGKFTMTDEAPGFNDPAILEDAASLVEYSDPILADPVVDAAVDEAEALGETDEIAKSCRQMAFVMRWGQIPFTLMQKPISDWSGTISVDRGALIVGRVLQFEPVTDQILPRLSRKVIDLESKTTRAWDGLIFRVVYGCDSLLNDGDDLVAPTVTIQLGDLFSATLETTNPYLHRSVEVDDIGNRVEIHSGILRPGCRTGLALGRYRRVDTEGRFGNFRGIVTSPYFDKFLGSVRGIYGVNHAGKNRFVAKFIDKHGSFYGISHGTYNHTGQTSEGENLGRFRGRLVRPENDHLGSFRGGYKQNGNEPAGSWIGFVRLERCRDSDDDMSDAEYDGLADPPATLEALP